MDLGLREKAVFVSGSSGGIGYAIAKTFLKEGSDVIIHGRDEEKLDCRMKALSEIYAHRASSFRSDLAVPGERDATLTEILRRFTRLDAAVFCVGNGHVPVGYDLTQEQWDAILAQNFFANAHMARMLAPLLKKAGQASICFIGSIAGLQDIEAPLGYAVAKSALNTYAKCLARELAPDGIRVNIVHPGNVRFEGSRWEQLREEDPNGIDEYVENEVVQKRFGTPEEIASIVTFLSSSQASFMTGASVVVDGGQIKSF